MIEMKIKNFYLGIAIGLMSLVNFCIFGVHEAQAFYKAPESAIEARIEATGTKVVSEVETIKHEPVEAKKSVEELIFDACSEYGVSYDICLAIARLETGWFTSDAFIYNNNPGGMMYGGSVMSFDSVESGVEAFVSNLAENYFYIGLDTPELIGPKYCPGSQHWIDQVRSLMAYE